MSLPILIHLDYETKIRTALIMLPLPQPDDQQDTKPTRTSPFSPSLKHLESLQTPDLHPRRLQEL